jgi:cytochrome P450
MSDVASPMRDIDEAISQAHDVKDAPAVPVTEYEDIAFVLRSKVFAPITAEAGHGGQWHTLVVRGVAADLHGDEHFERRRLLTSLLKRTAVLREYERAYLTPEMVRMFQAAGIEADGNTHLELVSGLRRVMISLVARLVGVDRMTSSGEADTEFERLLSDVERGVRSRFVEDPATVVRTALESQRRLVDEYFKPALARRTEIYGRVQDGTESDGAMPNDLLSLVVRHRAYYDEFGPDAANREASLLMVAAVGSTVNAICFAVRDLSDWLEAHPEDLPKRSDPVFLQRCFAESLRLGQVNDLFRTAMEDCTLPSGAVIRRGEVALIRRPAGNAGLEAGGVSELGEHCFDPNRTLQGGIAQFGLAFGGGAHMCIGKDFAVGGLPRLAQEADDQLGVGVRIFLMLQDWGVSVLPGGAELVGDMTGRPTWKRLLVSCSGRPVEAK